MYAVSFERIKLRARVSSRGIVGCIGGRHLRNITLPRQRSCVYTTLPFSTGSSCIVRRTVRRQSHPHLHTRVVALGIETVERLLHDVPPQITQGLPQLRKERFGAEINGQRTREKGMRSRLIMHNVSTFYSDWWWWWWCCCCCCCYRRNWRIYVRYLVYEGKLPALISRACPIDLALGVRTGAACSKPRSASLQCSRTRFTLYSCFFALVLAFEAKELTNRNLLYILAGNANPKLWFASHTCGWCFFFCDQYCHGHQNSRMAVSTSPTASRIEVICLTSHKSHKSISNVVPFSCGILHLISLINLLKKQSGTRARECG